MDISTLDLSYLSSNKIDTVHAMLWFDDNHSPKAILQIAHGMTEHIARYNEFASFFVQRGFVVCANDHLGHGATAPSPDALGYIPKRNGADYLVEDVHLLRKLVQARYRNLPVFLLGHSMGSLITRSYIIKYGEGLSGYICSGTSGPNPLSRIAMIMADLELLRIGAYGRSTILDRLAFGNHNKHCTEKRTKFDWLTKDQDIVDRYVNDPWCGYIFTAAGFRNLFYLHNSVSKKAWAYSVPKNLPIFIISGKEDPVGEYTNGTQIVYSRLRQAGVLDISLKLYENCRHEIINEINRTNVYADVLDWILTHLQI